MDIWKACLNGIKINITRILFYMIITFVYKKKTSAIEYTKLLRVGVARGDVCWRGTESRYGAKTVRYNNYMVVL